MVKELESQKISFKGWATPGATPVAAALDVARTACRRAERRTCAVGESGEMVNPEIIVYLNRLSDLLWLFGRQIELEHGVDSKLRGNSDSGPRWSRAW